MTADLKQTAAGGHHSRKERKDPILPELRVNQTGRPYEDMPPEEREAILDRIRNPDDAQAKSAAEYLHCYRLNRHPGKTCENLRAEMNVSRTLLNNWEKGISLSTPGFSQKLRDHVFITAEDAEIYEALVNHNLRRLMMQALDNGQHSTFRGYFKRMSAPDSAQALKAFAQSVPDEKPDDIIRVHGTYLHLLRNAVGIDEKSIARNTGVEEGLIKALESGSTWYGAEARRTLAVRKQLQIHLEGELAKREPELAALLASPEVQARIDKLPPGYATNPHASHLAKARASKAKAADAERS